MKRALRRHHYDRRKKAVTRHARTFGLRTDAVSVGIHARTRAPCSCWMCGNPRRLYAEPTMQERRVGAKVRDMDDELRDFVIACDAEMEALDRYLDRTGDAQ